MKKICLMLCTCLFLAGCGNYSSEDALKDFEKKVEDTKGYNLTGELEISNNDDIYKYDVEASYAKDDQFRVSLKNKTNNHEQIILKNSDGVYVQTHESTQQKKLNSLRLYPLKV